MSDNKKDGSGQEEPRSEKEEPRAEQESPGSSRQETESEKHEAKAETEEPTAETEEIPAAEEVPYKTISDLPKTLRDTLPEDAQHTYLDAYKKAWDSYTKQRGGQAGRESVANRDAMNAVQHDYVHDSESGKWRRKGEAPQAERPKSLIERIKEMF